MAAPKKPDLDEGTLRTMAQLVKMPPKLHEDMKLGCRKPSAVKAATKKKPAR